MARTKQAKISGVMLPSIDNDIMLEMKRREMQGVSTTAEAESTLSERALLVRFSIGRWYGSGADEEVVSNIKKAAEAEGEVGSFTKRLMKREHLAEINRVTNDARKYHKTMTLPWGDSGQRVLNIEVYREYKERMTAFERDFWKAVGEFEVRYPDLVKEEAKRLNKMYKASDYPSAEEIRSYFRFGLVIDTLPRTQDIRLKLSAEHAEEIKHDIEKRLHESLSGALTDVYARIADEVREAKEKLDDPDARLQTKMFSGLQEIIALLPKLNVVRDPKLIQMGRDLQKELISVPVDALRDDSGIRKQTAAKAGKMLDAIAKLKKGA